MAPEYLKPEEMRSIIKKALRKFAQKDMELLHVEVNELTIAHRVAIYMESHLTGWQVDCEYNRDLTFPKMRRSTKKRIIPDIIVHRRNSPRNLLIVEIKKSCHSKQAIGKAKQRAFDFTGEWGTDVPRYCHAVVLTFPIRRGEPRQVVCDWFHRTGCDLALGGEPKIGSMNVSLQQNH